MANITAAMVKELREITGAAMMDCKKALTESEGDLEGAKEILRKKGQAIANKKSSRETKEGRVAIFVGDNKASVVRVACETDFVAINEKFQNFINVVAEKVAETTVQDYKEACNTEGTAAKELFTTTIAGLGENMVLLDGDVWSSNENGAFGYYIHSTGKIGVLSEIVSDKADTDKAAMADLAKEISMHIAASHVEAVSEDQLDPAVVEKERQFQIEQAQSSGKPMNIIEKMIDGRMSKFKKEICLLEQGFVKSPDKTIAQLIQEVGKDLGCSLTFKRFHKAQF